MTSMTHDGPAITGGVDTHGLTHHAAVIDPLGRHLADREFPATVSGYRDLLDWMCSYGALTAVGVEGTGAYGAELARVLTAGCVGADRARVRRSRQAAVPSIPLTRCIASCQTHDTSRSVSVAENGGREPSRPRARSRGKVGQIAHLRPRR
ncbi:transposase [Kitasatospora sp. NPDC127059]|uniref:IS110 family transposase n=1 Tax=unclassified Kitasatospora TaxID=2633591 RepID=UPI003664535A